MILIVGGAASGKKTFARKLGYADSDMDHARVGSGRVLCDLQELLRDAAIDQDGLLEALLAYDIVICTEIGGGIVPASREERAWRNRVGRTCTVLAEKSNTVIRMVCAIPVAIKGELPCSS